MVVNVAEPDTVVDGEIVRGIDKSTENFNAFWILPCPSQGILMELSTMRNHSRWSYRQSGQKNGRNQSSFQ